MHLCPNDELLKKFVIVLGKHKLTLEPFNLLSFLNNLDWHQLYISASFCLHYSLYIRHHSAKHHAQSPLMLATN